MALRARENWGTMRRRVRQNIGEEDETDPHWTNQFLLDLFNEHLDLRFMQMCHADEGWSVDEYVADLVANQREYTMPVGADRIRQVKLVETSGGTITETPVGRSERWFDGVVHGSQPTTLLNGYYRPTYRMIGELLLLEPRPSVSLVGGLHVDVEAPQPKLTAADTSVLPQRFPLVMETLLVLDTAVAVFAEEDAQSETDPRVSVGRLERRRNRYEAEFLEYVESRQASPVFSRPMHLGD